MEFEGSISRRTRRQSEAYWDEFYRRRYNEIKKKPDQESYGDEEATAKPKSFGVSRLADKDSGKNSDDDDNEDGDDSDWHNEHVVVKKGSRRVGRPAKAKKKARTKTLQNFETKNQGFIEVSVADEDSEKSNDAKPHQNTETKNQGFGVLAADEDSERSSDGDSDWHYEHVGKKGPRKAGRPAKKARLLPQPDFDSMLEDWRLEEKDLVRENPVSVRDSNEGYTPPLKFSLNDDKSCLVKNMFSEEIEALFNDLEMGLWESQLGECRNSSNKDDESLGSKDADQSPTARCRRGEHDDVLDEQIGIHVVTSEKHEKKDGFEESKKSFMDQIQFWNSNSGNLESSVHSTGTVFDLIPESNSKELYQHQLEGFEFLWRNIAGETRIKNLQRLHSNAGRGCIISHSPGTGKTRLTMVFLQTFLKLYPNCRPVIIAPRGMLLTWEQELKNWKIGINFHNLNESKLSDQENETFAAVSDQARCHRKDKDYIRFVKLACWMKGGSILGIGYRMFEELAGENRENNKFKKVLLELPGLLVMDEGHTPRNNQSLMWKALTKVRTRRRVILSGTPFQNNFSELYNTLCLVNPRFSHQFSRKPGRKGRGRDEWNILTNSISRNSSNDDALKKLRSMIEPFVHIHKGSILQKTLPGMKDCLIILKPTDLQKKLLQKINKVEKYLEQANLASLIQIHPSLVALRPEFADQARTLKALKSDPNASAKTRFLVNLIQLSARLNEKVLIFSEFIPPLLHIRSLIRSHFKWNQGREIMYMDGEIGSKVRQHSIDSFNDRKGGARVMLASQRACSEGINLVGASRVVLLDVAWNPSVERQAICRAYRIGQERMVYVYHLVTPMEVKRYERQAEKERISELVFQGGGGGRFSGEGVWEDKVLEAMVGLESVGSMIEKIVHQPKETDLVNNFGFVDVK